MQIGVLISASADNWPRSCLQAEGAAEWGFILGITRRGRYISGAMTKGEHIQLFFFLQLLLVLRF